MRVEDRVLELGPRPTNTKSPETEEFFIFIDADKAASKGRAESYKGRGRGSSREVGGLYGGCPN